MSSKKPIPLFPPYLDHRGAHKDEGDSSSGLAIFCLKLLLHGTPFFEGYELNGEFDDELVATIKRLQENLGFTGADVDGCFGQGTREAFLARFGVDINALPLALIAQPTKARQPDGQMIGWPPIEFDRSNR